MNQKRVMGLICRLFIPDPPERMDWNGFLSWVSPHVDGFLLDPPFWRDRPGRCGMEPSDLAAVAALIDRLPPEKIVLCRVTGRDRPSTRSLLEALDKLTRDRPVRTGLFWLDLPLYYHSNRGLPDLYRDYGRLSPVPFMLENDPERVRAAKSVGRHVNLRTSVLKTLSLLPGIAGLIHHGNIDRALNYARAVVRRRDFSLMDGDERQFLEYPSTSGLVSIAANVFPRQWSVLVKNRLSGSTPLNQADILEIVYQMKHALEVVLENPAANLSHLLQRRGFLEGPEPAHGDRAERLDALLAAHLKD